ncbi:iron-sulfur cluster repair di-iron protein [Chryseobacterium sp. A301]
MTTLDQTIGQIVAQDYRAAAVFKKYGIDFCCNGNRTLEEATELKGTDVSQVVNELEHLGSSSSESIDYKSWPLDLLADYVEKTHHRYITDKAPILLQFLNKICKVHGGRHPELFEVFELFEQSANELTSHMQKEEQILFPFIRTMMDSQRNHASLQAPSFGTVENPVEMMMHEHDIEGERFRKIAELTNHYQFPEDACSTYQVSFRMLEEFEDDLHKHIHIENNILFPKALELEKALRN